MRLGMVAEQPRHLRPADFRWRSALASAAKPASSIVQPRGCRSARPAAAAARGCGKCTSLVATSGADVSAASARQRRQARGRRRPVGAWLRGEIDGHPAEPAQAARASGEIRQRSRPPGRAAAAATRISPSAWAEQVAPARDGIRPSPPAACQGEQPARAGHRRRGRSDRQSRLGAVGEIEPRADDQPDAAGPGGACGRAPRRPGCCGR